MYAFFQRVAALFVACIVYLAGLLGITDIPFVEPVEDFKVTAYVRGDYVQTADSLFAEDFDIITDVILFECASFNSDGEVVFDENKLETALANIRTAVGDRNVHITLNLLGPTAQTSAATWEEQMEAQSIEHNKAFASGVLEDNILAVLDRYDFDGVHFDYEYPLSEDAWKGYNRFLVSLDKKLGDYTLGVAASTWNFDYSTAAIAAVDTFELMIYDFLDANGRHATTEGMIENVNAIAFEGVAREKINIGLPFYARPTDLDAYWHAYNTYYEGIDADGWYHCEDTNKDFWFNTPEVIAEKTEYALANGYGGVMVWHYNCDLPSSHPDSLFRAIGTVVK
ncbi:MAG: glycoside hydrolase family 18 protein [Clostridia bacterium]|nr:glycoside hydrolase family 18 protein [Clostridia bacterium]